MRLKTAAMSEKEHPAKSSGRPWGYILKSKYSNLQPDCRKSAPSEAK
jgi:hypothetical protein